MKGLNQFVKFDWDAFAQGKTFIVTGKSENLDWNSKKHLGSKIEVVIASDNTQYTFKDGTEFTNQYEKIAFKLSKDIDIPVGTRVVPKNAVAVVFGQFQNQLSVRCDDILVVTPKEK